MKINDCLNIDWLKNNHKLIHSFGLGFIQIKINEEFRLHVYCPEATLTSGEEEVHDHRYDFTSYILKGSLTNKIYELDYSKNDFLLIQENCSPNKELNLNSPKEVGLKLVNSSILSQNSSYFMEKDALHRVETSRCITLLKRGLVVKDLANVVYKKGQELKCPFSVNKDSDYLWSIVEKELKSVY